MYITISRLPQLHPISNKDTTHYTTQWHSQTRCPTRTTPLLAFAISAHILASCTPTAFLLHRSHTSSKSTQQPTEFTEGQAPSKDRSDNTNQESIPTHITDPTIHQSNNSMSYAGSYSGSYAGGRRGSHSQASGYGGQSYSNMARHQSGRRPSMASQSPYDAPSISISNHNTQYVGGHGQQPVYQGQQSNVGYRSRSGSIAGSQLPSSQMGGRPSNFGVPASNFLSAPSAISHNNSITGSHHSGSSRAKPSRSTASRGPPMSYDTRGSAAHVNRAAEFSRGPSSVLSSSTLRPQDSASNLSTNSTRRGSTAGHNQAPSSYSRRPSISGSSQASRRPSVSGGSQMSYAPSSSSRYTSNSRALVPARDDRSQAGSVARSVDREFPSFPSLSEIDRSHGSSSGGSSGTSARMRVVEHTSTTRMTEVEHRTSSGGGRRPSLAAFRPSRRGSDSSDDLDTILAHPLIGAPGRSRF